MSQGKLELHSSVDDDGFVALVCPDTYSGYISDDWTLEQILARFTEQMNAGALFTAYPGPDLANASLRISDTPSKVAAQREASGLVRVGSGGLWLTDYTQLTMAAQFSDEPPQLDRHVRLPILPGIYRVTLRQLASSYDDELKLVVELIIEPMEIGESYPKLEAVPWFE